MRQIFLLFLVFVALLEAKTSLDPLMLTKGKKIAKRLCDEQKLLKISSTLSTEEISKAIIDSKACIALNKERLQALSYFLKSKNSIDSSKKVETIKVPNGAKCPVCGMFVSKYPKWASEMIVNGKIYYFDGVKDMMKFYIFDGDFPYDRSKIEKILVTDYYTLEAIPAKSAFYVIGSKIYGPMGNEFIPFLDIENAKTFKENHRAKNIIKFNEIRAHIKN